MKRSLALLLSAAVCFSFTSSTKAQSIEFEFTPETNSLGAGGTDFTTPSYITFTPTAGSFSYGIAGDIAAIPDVTSVGGPTNGTYHVESWDINTPDGELDTANSTFDPGTEYAYWSTTRITSLDLSLTSDSTSLTANLEPYTITYSDPFTINGAWTVASAPDAGETIWLLAGVAAGLFALRMHRAQTKPVRVVTR